MKKNLKKYTCMLAALLASSALAAVPKIDAKADIRIVTEGAAVAGAERYFDAAMLDIETRTETVTFTEREQLSYIYTVNNMPCFTQSSNLPNSCGAIAGAMIVAFYDKYFENLIPNYTAYYTSTGRYKVSDNVYIPALKQELYTLMRTNVDDVGVSRNDCLDGLEEYVENKGQTLSYTCLKSTANASLNESGLINAINNNQPMLLFCNEAQMVMLGQTDTQDTFTYYSIANNHIMVGYGYYKVRYYNGSTLLRTDTFLIVESGLDGYSQFTTLNNTSWLNGVYAVDIT